MGSGRTVLGAVLRREWNGRNQSHGGPHPGPPARLRHLEVDATDEQLLLAVRKWLNGAGFRKHKRNTNGQGLTLYSPSDDARWSTMGAAERERAYLGRS